VTVFIGHDVFCTGFDRRFHDLVGIADSSLVGDLADMVEGEGYRTGFAECTTGLGEGRADDRGRTVAVVGQRLDDDGNAAGTIALVADRVIGLGIGTGGLLDCALDVVLRHRLCLGVLHSEAKCRIHRGVRQTGLCSHRDFARELGEHLGTDTVLLPLAVHDVFKL